MRKFKIVTVAMCVITLVISIITNMGLYNNIKEKETYNRKLRAQLKNISSDNTEKNFEEYVEKYYEEKLKKAFDKKLLKEATSERWNYWIEVNGQELTSNRMYINSNNVEITLNEYVEDKKNLFPQSILVLGSITEGHSDSSIEEHILLKSIQEYSSKVEKKDFGQKITYTFNDIPKGSSIYIYVSGILQERINKDKEIDEEYIGLDYIEIIYP